MITFTPSFIYTESLQNGQGSNISINTEQLSVLNGSQLITRSFENANAGDIYVRADTINVMGASNTPGFAEQNFEIFSQINSITFGSGTGGDIQLDANNLSTSQGGAITSVTNGFGSGGNVNIDSTNIDLIGSVPNLFLPSSIGAVTISEGDAGRIFINSENISLLDGASISTSTLASGNAGDIEINATNLIQITKTDEENPLFSSISSAGLIAIPEIRDAFGLPPTTTGNAGNVTVSALKVELDSASQINVANFGSGDGGRLTINANSINLNNGGQINASTASGQGGNIDLNTENLELLEQSQISASARGLGDGGNITIDTDSIIGSNNSDITANAFQGNGGNIEINSDVILGIQERESLTSNSDVTADSELGIDGTVTINSPDTNADDEIVFAPIRYTDTPLEFLKNICSPSIDNEGKFTITNMSAEETPYNMLDRNDKYSRAIEQIEQGAELDEVLKETRESSVLPNQPIIEPNTVKTDEKARQYLVATNITERVSSPRLCEK